MKQKLHVEREHRPRCSVEGCNNPGKHDGSYRKDGTPRFKKMCAKHHGEKVAKKHGLKTLDEVMAKSRGFATVTEYKNSMHPYLKYRKSYCENIDGRFGYVCTTTIMLLAQLEVDHIDGNPYNNDPSNLQTLCGCCHTYKTIVSGDGKTPGRKTLKKYLIF